MVVDILAGLLHYFENFGPVGKIAFLFLVFCLDAMVIPTLPELFVMGFFAAPVPGPSIEWGLTLLITVMAAEVTGTMILYSAIHRFGLPGFLETRMRQWVQFLVVHDERIILVNRVAPVVPFLGAFIATMKWDLRKSLSYVVIGGGVKYTVLLIFVAVLFVQFDPVTARNITLIAIVSLVGVSVLQGELARKRHLGPVATKVAHVGEHSHASPPPSKDGNEHPAGGKEPQNKDEAKAGVGRS